MRLTTATVIIAVMAVCGFAIAQPQSTWGLADIQDRLAQHAQRACIYPIGGWAIINCSNSAAAQSAELNAWSRYVIQCGDDSYLATGDASTDEADSSDGWLPSGAWLEFMTTSTVRYISCLNKNADSDCRILECQ